MFDFLKPKRKHAEAEVVAVKMTSPHMCCVTLGGEQIAAFLEADGVDVPATWVKVHLPSGHSRAYTIRRIDRHAGTLDLEFVLHERDGVSGPASTWASQAQVGQRISIAGPRDGGFLLPADVSWIILAGDATALPAMQAIAQVLPADIKAAMYAEVEAPEDHQIVESPARLEIAWLDEASTPGAALHRELAGKPLPATPGLHLDRGRIGCRASAAQPLSTDVGGAARACQRQGLLESRGSRPSRRLIPGVHKSNMNFSSRGTPCIFLLLRRRQLAVAYARSSVLPSG